MRASFPLRLYSAATSLLRPAAPFLLAQRAARGKERTDRLQERRGRATRARPDGPLLWLHGASVGESLSVLPLIDILLASRPGLNVLVTTGTLTSAELMETRLPEGAFHQFVPLDAPAYARRFFEHWKPDLGVFIESELWPNLIREAASRDVPLALVNGRLSERSLQNWQRAPATARQLLGAFSVVMAQDDASEKRYAALGADPVLMPGNLKYDAPPLPCDETALGKLETAVAGRPVWLAASTHEGEERMIAAAHVKLRAQMPDLLTLIAPRHPARAHDMRNEIEAMGLTAAQRSLERLPQENTDIYLADTMGELGLFYRLVPLVFIGGSLVPHGGHNPLEAARLDTALLFGPHMFNFAELAQLMLQGGGGLEVKDSEALAAEAGRLLSNSREAAARAEEAHNVAATLGGASMRAAHQLLALMPEGESRERPHA